jgi:hypothetical protein
VKQAAGAGQDGEDEDPVAAIARSMSNRAPNNVVQMRQR